MRSSGGSGGAAGMQDKVFEKLLATKQLTVPEITGLAIFSPHQA